MTATTHAAQIVAAGIGLVVALGVVITPADAAVKPRHYANCKALNHVYPHGVGRVGAHDHVPKRDKPVTDFTRNTKVYNLNKASDRDHDGIACEKH